MTEEEDTRTWEEALTPIIHDDGKGMTVCLHLDNADGTTLAVHLTAEWQEEFGLPNFDLDAVRTLTANAAMDFDLIVFPEGHGDDDEPES